MATGKLTRNEQYIIQGMRHDNKDVAEIAKSLGRTEKAVANYLTSLDSLHSTVAAVQTEQVVEEPVPVAREMPTSEEVVQKAVMLLVKSGQTERDAQKLVNQALRTFFANVGTDQPEKLMKFALRFVKSGELMKKSSVGGSDGVTIMTEAASDRGDYAKKFRQKKASKKFNGSVFSLKDGEQKNPT